MAIFREPVRTWLQRLEDLIGGGGAIDPVARAAATAAQADIDGHEADLANPHTVTKTQVGLSAVANGLQVLADWAGGYAAKTTLALADTILIGDSAAGGALKRTTVSVLGLTTDIHVPPVVAHADDEEFNGTSLPAAVKFMRADTNALITPGATVDPWTVVTTGATARAQVGFRRGWLSIQPYDFNNGGNLTQAVHAFKTLSAITTNMAVIMRISHTGQLQINRDGNVTFSLAADSVAVPGTPDMANRCVIAYTVNGGSTNALGETVIANALTVSATRTLGGSYYTGFYDGLAMVKRGGSVYFYIGGASGWEQLGQPLAFAPTIAHVAFQCSCDVGGVAPHTIHHVDYIRRNDTGVLP